MSCSLVIEEELADIGVQAKIYYAKQLVDVTYDEKKTDIHTIRETIEKLGYTVSSYAVLKVSK